MQGRRRNITRACDECRRRRIKCDGMTPCCSRCLDRSLLCHYTTESDGRRPGCKAHVETLHKRISVLERALRMHGVNIEEAVARVLEEDETQDSSKRSNCSNSVTFGSANAISPIQTDRTVSMTGTISASQDTIRTAIEGTLTMEESLNFDQDGEVRYFGPSSGRLQFQANRHRNSTVVPHSFESILDGSAPLPAIGLKQNQLIKSVMEDSKISEELQTHLIDMYFTWEQPWCWVVNERLFRESQQSGGRYFSPLLLNCVLAIASRYTDRVDVRSDPSDPNTAGRLFLENAEVLLHYDLKWPTITTIQALSIMGTIYVAQGADAAGWLHQGMANRLAIDMGLNLDAASLKPHNTMPSEEVDLRRQIYWALYCVDKLSAAYTGRVCTFLDSQGVVNLPNVNCSHKGREDSWSFDADEGYSLFTVRTSYNSLHHAIITLCRILETILLNLYAPKPACSGQQRTAFLLSCASELKKWHLELPPELQIEGPSSSIRIPHVFTTHMVYHTAIILLHKPFLDESRQTNCSAKAPDHSTMMPISDTTVMRANIACYEAAKAICAASQKYREIFGSFRRSPLTATHCNLMAALVFLQRQRRGAGTKKTPFDTCAIVLKELSDSWNPAGRLLQNILKLRTSDSASQRSPKDPLEDIILHAPSQSSREGEPLRIRSDRGRGIQSHGTQFDLVASQSQFISAGMQDWGVMDADMASAPYLVSEDLTFDFDSLPSDYSAFGYLSSNFVR